MSTQLNNSQSNEDLYKIEIQEPSTPVPESRVLEAPSAPVVLDRWDRDSSATPDDLPEQWDEDSLYQDIARAAEYFYPYLQPKAHIAKVEVLRTKIRGKDQRTWFEDENVAHKIYLESNFHSITLDIHASTNKHPPHLFPFQATQCK